MDCRGQALNKTGKPDYFVEDDVQLMQAFCNEVAVALKRKSVEAALTKVIADNGNARDRVRQSKKTTSPPRTHFQGG